MVLIPSLLYLTLRSAAVQTYLAQKVASYLSSELNAKVNVGGVNISWFMNVVLEDISVMDRKEQPILYAQRMVFDVKRISSSSKILIINKLLLENASLGIIKYAGDNDYNFRFLVEYFLSDKTDDRKERPNWNVMVRSVEFEDSGLSFKDHNKSESIRGFDYNHFAFGGLNISLTDIFYENDTLNARLNHFSVRESKGLYIQDVSAELQFGPYGSFAKNLVIRTENTHLSINAFLTYEGFQAFDNFADEVVLGLEIQPSILGLYELGYFLPPFYGLSDKLTISGNFAGPLSNIKASNVGFKYGRMSEFRGNFTATGLPDIQETFLNFTVERFIASKTDIESFKLPHYYNTNYLSLPDEVTNLGLVNFTGKFTGFIHDFVAYGQFYTSLGTLSTDIAIISSYDFNKVSYRGNLSTKGFDIGKLINKPDQVGQIALNTNVVATGKSFETLNLEMTGTINSLELMKYQYQNARVSGHFYNKRFNGNLLVEDPNLFLYFAGLVDFGEKIPVMNFSAQIDNANLSELNIFQRDSLYNVHFSSSINVDGKGNSIENMEGIVNAFSTRLEEIPVDSSENLEPRLFQTLSMTLESHKLENDQTHLRFTSDFLDAQIEGELNPDNLGQSARRFLSWFSPSLSGDSITEPVNGRYAQNIDFDFHIKEPNELLEFFIPEYRISPDAVVKGNWNTHTHELFLEGLADYFHYGTSKAIGINIKANTFHENLKFESNISRVAINDSIGMDQFIASGKLNNDSLLYSVRWDNHNPVNKSMGRIEGLAHVLSPRLSEISFFPSYAYINDSLWTISPEGRIKIDTGFVQINDFRIFKNNEYLQADGILSNNPEDIFRVELSQFDIESLNFLLKGRKVDFAGVANGKLELSNLAQAPNITANLIIKNFAFNKDHLGDLDIASNWDAKEKAFKVETNVIYYGNIGSNIPLSASGYFYPDREHDNFDLDINIENLKMSVFSRYLSGFASNFRGLASGKLRLDGPLSAPELSGKARLTRTGFKINYLNTAYTFAHEVEVGKDYFRFDNLTLNDTLGNTANVTGIIRHNNFFNFSVDISMLLDRIITLNTQPYHNDLFYGKGFASGLVHIYGPVKNIVMNISAQANRGTQFFLPLDYQGEITESNFITFVEADRRNERQALPMAELSGLTLNFDLTVTPESEVQLIFDSKIGDIIRGRGTGNLKIEITPQGSFYMYGDYLIDEGEYLFTLQNLINKRFRIQQGGLIRWSGNPYDADIDLRAIYRTRTSLADLAMSVMQSDTSDVYRRRVPVETVLHLEEKLFNPAISFDIQIPGGDEESREMISRLITTEQEMNRQVFSLLILNRFTPNPAEYNSALGYGVGSTSTELLSNQLSNWLSQLSSDFDIGINYRPGDEISSQELEVALSTQLFDDRVVIDGNVGVAGNHPASSQRTSNIIGDVNIEVKITPEGKFRVKAFNRSNTFDVLNTNSPYTQGIGVFYRKEFDNLSDLFKKKRRPLLEEIPEPELIESELPDIEALDSTVQPVKN